MKGETSPEDQISDQNWICLPRPLLGPQTFSRLRRAKNWTRFQEMYVKWNGLPRSLLEPQFFSTADELKRWQAFKKCMLTGMAYRGHYTSNCFRMRRAKNVTRFQEMYVNWNGVPRPVVFIALFLSFNLYTNCKVR